MLIPSVASINKLSAVVAVVAFATSLALPSMTAWADTVPAGATWSQVWFPSEDGTMLRADVLLPADRDPDDRHPVILSIGPYFGRNSLNEVDVAETGPVMRFADVITGGNIFERGYAWVQVDSRGYGGSDGCNDFGGRGEQMDSEAAVNWAGAQPWSNGRVGMWGMSYDSWTQVMALAENPVSLKAAVIQSPLIETYRGMWMNGVHFSVAGGGGWYLTPGNYALWDLSPSVAGDAPPEERLYPAKGTATNPDCYAENLGMTLTHDRSLPYWQERDIVDLAARSDVPVIWSHGMNDRNTKPHNFLDVFSRLQGPKRVWVGQWAHQRASQAQEIGRDGFITEAMAWFDHYLKGLPLADHPAAEVQDQEGIWRTEAQWPPADATPLVMPLKNGSYLDDGNTSSGYFSVTRPAPYDLRISGTPRLNVDVTTDRPLANLVAQVYDVAPDGTGRLITRGAYRLGSSGTVGFDLFPAEWIVREGNRIAVRLSSFDNLFHVVGTHTTVGAADGSLSIPFLRYLRNANLEGGRASSTSPALSPTLTESQITAAEVEMEFPPRMVAPPTDWDNR